MFETFGTFLDNIQNDCFRKVRDFCLDFAKVRDFGWIWPNFDYRRFDYSKFVTADSTKVNSIKLTQIRLQQSW